MGPSPLALTSIRERGKHRERGGEGERGRERERERERERVEEREEEREEARAFVLVCFALCTAPLNIHYGMQS